MVKQKNKKIWLMALAVFAVVFGVTFLAQRISDRDAEAANLADFDPGYIISDYQMGNYDSMSESQIQNFLKSKNSCNDRDLGKYTYGNKVGYFSESTPYTWHVKDGHFVCMADESFNGESAAHIIWQAAQDFRINPKVLIVVLQKEQGLVTDTFPNSIQYRSAMGYGCPDTAPCSPEYAGFRNQVRNAAEMFREVLDGGWSNYPVGENYIKYSPTCNGSWVNVRNKATSALYRYTPYQPNRAVLNGGSDGCSAYGNANFYRYFEDWFGGIKDTQKSAGVTEGVYYIRAVAAKSMMLDVKGGNAANGTNIQLYSANNTDAQKWKITYNSVTDDYNIINVATQKALDVDAAGISNGTNIQLWEPNGTCAQRWKIVETGGVGVKIISACSSKVMDISNGNMMDGNNIKIWEYNKTDAQKWELMPTDIVEDGLYEISSSIDGNKEIDIHGGSYGAEDGTNIQIWNKNNTAAQRWYVERDKNGYYTVKNLQSGKVLDVQAAGTKNQTNVQAWEPNGTCAQKWRILKSNNGYVFISNCSYKVVDLAKADTNRGSNIQIYEANNTKAQQWNMNPATKVEEGDYVIVSKLSDNKVVDIKGNNKERGTNIQLYEANGTSAQKWSITYDKSTDTYTILNKGTGKVLDIEWGGTTSGTNVQTWTENGTCAQRWAIMKTGNEHVFYSACSGLVLDVSGAGTKNGTNIQVYSENDTAAQKWILMRAENE